MQGIAPNLELSRQGEAIPKTPNPHHPKKCFPRIRSSLLEEAAGVPCTHGGPATGHLRTLSIARSLFQVKARPGCPGCGQVRLLLRLAVQPVRIGESVDRAEGAPLAGKERERSERLIYY